MPSALAMAVAPRPCAFISHRRHVYRSLAALIDASRLGPGDAFELALAAQIFELRKRSQHVQEASPGGSVDRLAR
jgi:hypothetical protein